MLAQSYPKRPELHAHAPLLGLQL
eukprot:COSAG06_NODE_30689_length_534_cov_0.850575_2_plen_23_part_01